MKNKTNLYNATKKILKEVRFGNLSNRLNSDLFQEDIEFVNDFNNMLESIIDREEMIKEYQAYILEQAEHLKSLFNMLNEGAMTLSEDFKIITVNDMQAKWLRKTKQKLIGLSIFDILKPYNIKEFSSNKVITNFSKLFEKDRKNYKFSVELKRKKMTFSLSIKKYLDKNDKQNYFVIVKDITPDVNLQKLKDTFFTTLTHDLKVPILAEEKVLELFLKESFGKNTQEQKEALENMLFNNKDIISLVNTLLDVYKLEDGVYKINRVKSDILKLINLQVDKLKFLMAEKGCKVLVKAPQNMPAVWIDEEAISRVINNILTNAIGFSPEKSEIFIDLEIDDENIHISITDQGSGIEPKDISYIFDRYYTAAKKYRKVGTGLGLYLSKKIILLHQGDISVKSIPNIRTTFDICLPIKDNINHCNKM